MRVSELRLGPKGAYGRLVTLMLLAPLLGSSVGVDGGPIFQIFAIENLGLSPAAIGLALGLGVVSVPLQIRAARNRIERSRHNLQLFLVVVAFQAWLLAALVALAPIGRWAYLALGVTVIAEINLSILFAPAAQPLLSAAVSADERQRINSRIRAMAVVFMTVSLVVFGLLSQTQRSIFLGLVGVAALAVAVVLGGITPPEAIGRSTAGASIPSRPPLPDGVRSVYLAFSLLALGAWPLFLVYVARVLWPEANLGLIGAVQLLGPVVALLVWRSSAGPMAGRARAGSFGVLTSVLLLASVSAPVTGTLAKTALVGALFLSGFSITTTRLASLELIHRLTDEASSVRSFTLLDVVASTSLQIGLGTAGLLIGLSERYSDWPLDPYRLYLLGFAVAAGWAIFRLRDD